MLAPYSIVFTAHSSLQTHAMYTKKECVYCDNDSTLNLVHTNFFSVGKHTGNYTIISGLSRCENTLE